MSKIEKLTVTLPPDLAKQVETAVAEGEYGSSSEVIHDALQLWTDRRALARDLPTLRAAWRDGKASGPARPLELGRLTREARAERKA